MVNYLSATLNGSNVTPNKILKRACCSQFLNRFEFWHKETKNSGELINFFWDYVIPTDWKCEKDYFLFKDLVSHLIMYPFIHGKKENVVKKPSDADCKMLRNNFEDVSKNTYYKTKLSAETQSTITKEFEQVFTQWKHGNSNAGAVEQVKSKYDQIQIITKFHNLNDYFREVMPDPSPLESLVNQFVIPELKKTKPFEEEEEDDGEEDEEEEEDGAQGFPAKNQKKTIQSETQDDIATQLPSKPVRETRSSPRLSTPTQPKDITPKSTPTKGKAGKTSPTTKDGKNGSPDKNENVNNKKRKNKDEVEETEKASKKAKPLELSSDDDSDDENSNIQKKEKPTTAKTQTKNTVVIVTADIGSDSDRIDNGFDFVHEKADFSMNATKGDKAIKKLGDAVEGLSKIVKDPMAEAFPSPKKGEKDVWDDLDSTELKTASAFDRHVTQQRPKNKAGKQAPMSNSKGRVKFTLAEDAALIKGLKHYSKGNWSDILSRYRKEFHSKRTNVSLKDRHNSLVKLGTINYRGDILDKNDPLNAMVSNKKKVPETPIDDVEDSADGENQKKQKSKKKKESESEESEEGEEIEGSGEFDS
jgi:hypothetical protein